jgi:hypothetical protein
MPVSYIPTGSGQVDQGPDPRGLVQLALAVHQSKLAEEDQKKQEAMSRIKMLIENPDLMSMMDPNSIQKDIKMSGFDLAKPEQVAAVMKMFQGGGVPEIPTTPTPSAKVPVNQVEQLGATIQGNAAGAQSATPPSKEAARRAPGGGVTPGGIVTPGTGQLQQLEQGAIDSFTKQFGALAPLYGGAALQKQQQFMTAQKQQEIHQLYLEASGGGPGAVRAFATLNMLNGKTTTADEMRAIWSASDNPAVRKESIDYMLGNETGSDLAKRTSDGLKTILGSPSIMGKLKDPTDAVRLNDSVISGHGVPSDIMKRPFTLDEVKDINVYQKQLVDQGFPPDDARKAAEAQAIGISYALTMPASMHGLTIPQQEAAAKTTTAAGAYMRGQGAIMEGQAALERVKLEHDKITKSLDEQLKEKLENMLALQKGGVVIPQEMLDENLTKVAAQSGIQIQRVYTWWHWLSGKLQATGGTVSKGALEGQGPTSLVEPGSKAEAARKWVEEHGTTSPENVAYVESLKKKNKSITQGEADNVKKLPMVTIRRNP